MSPVCRIVMLGSLSAALPLALTCNASAAPPTVKFSKKLLAVNLNEGCDVADVNRDGKPDVIAGPLWYAAPDFVPRPIRDIPEVGNGEYVDTNGDHAYDVNGDGWVDVVSIGFFGTELCWFENPGAEGYFPARAWKKHVLATTNTRNEAIALYDFDGDGTPEVFVNSWDKKAPVLVWRLTKNEKGEPAAEQFVLGDMGGGHGFGIGDLNGDGRADVLVEQGWYEQPAEGPFAKVWKHHLQPALPHASCPFLVMDITGDGRSDIVWGKGHDYGLYWWEQTEPKADGELSFAEHTIDESWSQPHNLVWADLDGDGKGELVAGKRVRAHGGKDPGGTEPAVVFYYTWDPSAEQFTRHEISGPGGDVGGGMQLRVADLNGDGRPDILAPGKSGTYILFNEGSGK
ncbi:MAG: FG-GAP repeat domain-containing protein [Planctomycetota bacterium]